MFGRFIQDQFGRLFAHHFKIGGDGSDAVHDYFFNAKQNKN